MQLLDVRYTHYKLTCLSLKFPYSKVADLEEALSQSKQAHRSSLDTISAKLSEKTHELNSSELEGDQLRAVIASLEGRIKVAETTAQSKVSALEAEVGQMKAALHQQEALAAEYKARVRQNLMYHSLCCNMCQSTFTGCFRRFSIRSRDFSGTLCQL